MFLVATLHLFIVSVVYCKDLEQQIPDQPYSCIWCVSKGLQFSKGTGDQYQCATVGTWKTPQDCADQHLLFDDDDYFTVFSEDRALDDSGYTIWKEMPFDNGEFIRKEDTMTIVNGYAMFPV